MRLVIALALALTASVLPASAPAGEHTEAKIVTHASTLHAKCLPCVCTDDLGPYACGVTPLDVTGDVDYSYTHAYVQLVDLDPALGVSEVSFGLDYDGAPDSGVDGLTWYQCLPDAMTSQAPDPEWPQPGSWIRIEFDACRGTTPHPLDPEGQGSVLLGAYQLWATSSDRLSFVPAPDPDHPGETRIRVVDCSGEVTELPADRVASLGFGNVAGYDPCYGTVPVRPTTWSRLKRVYRTNE